MAEVSQESVNLKKMSNQQTMRNRQTINSSAFSAPIFGLTPVKIVETSVQTYERKPMRDAKLVIAIQGTDQKVDPPNVNDPSNDTTSTKPDLENGVCVGTRGEICRN